MTQRKAATATRQTDKAEKAFDLNDFLPYRLLVVTSRITQAYAFRYKRDFQISIPESRVINVLGNHSPLSSWEICERTAMTKTRVSVAITHLVHKGILHKDPHPVDQRQLSLSLTPKGQALRARIAVVAREMESDIIAACGRKGRQALMDLLNQIEHEVERLPI